MLLGTLEKVDEIIRDFTAVYAQYDAESFVGDVEELTYCRTAQQKERIQQQLLEQLRKDPHNPDLLYKVAIISGDLGYRSVMYHFLEKAAKNGHQYAQSTLSWKKMTYAMLQTLIAPQKTLVYPAYPLNDYYTSLALAITAFLGAGSNSFVNSLTVDKNTYTRTVKGACLISKKQSHWMLEAKEFAPELEEGLALLESAARAGRADALCNLGQYWWCQGLLHQRQEYFDCALKYLNASIKYSPRALFALFCVYSPSKPGPQHLKDPAKAARFLLYINFSDDLLVKTIYSVFLKQRRILPPLSDNNDITQTCIYYLILKEQQQEKFAGLLFKKDPKVVIDWLQPRTDIAPSIQENLWNHCYELLQKVLPSFALTKNEHVLELQRLLTIQQIYRRMLPETAQFFAGFSAQQLLTLGGHFLTTYPWPQAEEKSATESKEENAKTQKEQGLFQEELLELLIRCYCPKGIRGAEDKAYVENHLKPEARDIVQYIYNTKGTADPYEKFWQFFKGFLYYQIPVAEYAGYGYQDFVCNPPAQLPERWQQLGQLIMRMNRATMRVNDATLMSSLFALGCFMAPAARNVAASHTADSTTDLNKSSASMAESCESKTQVSQSAGASASMSAVGPIAAAAPEAVTAPAPGASPLSAIAGLASGAVTAPAPAASPLSAIAGLASGAVPSPTAAEQKSDTKSETVESKEWLEGAEVANQERQRKFSELVPKWSPIFSRISCESFVQRHPCLYNPAKGLLVFQCLSMLPLPLKFLALAYVWDDSVPEVKADSKDHAAQVSRHPVLTVS